MWSNENNSDSEEDEEVEQTETYFKPTFVVIAIDTHPLMFRKRENKSSPFKDCLSACHSLANSLLLRTGSRTWNQFSVLLAKEESPCLTEFSDNLIDTIKLLKAKAALPRKQLADEYQRKGDFDLAAFLLACKKVFHDVKSPFYKRTLIYITDDDEPVPDAEKRFTALNEIRTFNGNQIDFQIIPTTSQFNYNKFYNELFSLLDNPPLEEICEDEEGLTEKLTSAIVMRHKKRKMVFYPFKDDPSRFINCNKMDFIQASKLINTKVTKEGKFVKLTQDEDFVEAPYYFRSSVPGQETIIFSSYEKDCLMDNSLPLGLTLLYVSKRSVEVGYVIGLPFLLQLKDKDDKYFNKFWQCCKEKERVLVCLLKLRQPGKIRYVELIPVTINNNPTFLVKNIPFSHEIVLPKKSYYPELEDDTNKKQAIRHLVHSLTFDFNMNMIPDPCYRKQKEYIKAKLLDEPMEEAMDVTFNITQLDECLKESVKMINSNFIFGEQKKRKTATSSSRSKRTK